MITKNVLRKEMLHVSKATGNYAFIVDNNFYPNILKVKIDEIDKKQKELSYIFDRICSVDYGTMFTTFSFPDDVEQETLDRFVDQFNFFFNIDFAKAIGAL